MSPETNIKKKLKKEEEEAANVIRAHEVATVQRANHGSEAE